MYEELKNNLRSVIKKESEKHHVTGELRVDQMAQDCLNAIEHLDRKVDEITELRNSYFNLPVCQELGGINKDKLFLYLDLLRSTSEYNAYVLDAAQSGAIPLVFEKWLSKKKP